jgi:hypothetical protein
VTIGGGQLGGNLLLWIGLTPIALSLLLAFAVNVYAWRIDGDLGARQGPTRGGSATDNAGSIAGVRDAV